MMILQFGVEFRELYELVVSAWAVTFNKQQATLDLSPSWFKKCTSLLPVQTLGVLEQIRKMDQHIIYALLLNSPEPTAQGFTSWISGLSGNEIHELVYSFRSDVPQISPKILHQHCQMLCKGLNAWNEAYFSRIDKRLISVLEENAQQSQSIAAEYENRPQDLVQELTQSIIWEAEAVTQVTLIPQIHLSPWSIYEFGSDHGVIFYPVASLIGAKQELPPTLNRLLKAIGDNSRAHILRHIGTGIKSFTEIVQLTGLAKSTVHHHLITLRAAGLLWLHVSDDRSTRYSIRWDAIQSLTPTLENFLKQNDS